MCRIFGCLDQDVTLHQLRTLSALQRHGGPDAQASRRYGEWAVGNNRLAIMDVDGGQQPYTELGGQIQVVFNGEIYNHRELRDELRGKGHVLPDECDGSVIPALYLEHGTDFPLRLDGMYAVAVLDLRGPAPQLVLAVDDVGMKPLYYHRAPGQRRFYFASEIPALLAMPGVRPEPSDSSLDSYLATKTPFGEQTAFSDIRVLPPGSTAVLRGSDELRIRRRATGFGPDGDLRQDGGFGLDGDFDAAARQVRELLRHEVRRLLTADVPVSVITSGGLDSSLVTAIAAELVPDLHSFNIAYLGDWPADERHYAREVAQRCATVHHQVVADPRSFPDLLPDVVWHLGQPNADPITVSTYLLFQQVGLAGFKVAVSGDAADELFGGYDRTVEALSTTGDGWAERYVDALAAVPASLRTALYTAEYADHVRRSGSVSAQLVDRLRASAGDRLDALTEIEIGLRLPAYHLRRVDHLSMAHAVEVRLPFCQPAVVRLAGRLPAEHKVLGDRRKRVLYAAASGLVPRSVLDRPKQPFTLPIQAMLRAGEPLLDFARGVLETSRLRRDGLLDPTAVAGLFERQLRRPSAASASAIWALLIYQLWIDQFGVRPAAVAGRP